jgi:hypothetical protein
MSDELAGVDASVHDALHQLWGRVGVDQARGDGDVLDP